MDGWMNRWTNRQHAGIHSMVYFFRYTPSQQGPAFNSGAKQRIIRMVEVQKDPMEPPRFKTNTKIPRGPPSPPAPVLHSPPRKVTAIEPCNRDTNTYNRDIRTYNRDTPRKVMTIKPCPLKI